ncbi:MULTISPECIES: VirB4 family type IV secretion/conjugal transfer ATPase [unclassified Leisingera]|uniref:VirB4 family type IV secretion/conjugal transfer ATPase n=1 Tax=unclassified Leisingera TaxID=2614906 RepID=UPI001012A04A|nr:MULTISPECIES: VirB4 family type IV secretion/conjugal transfer ATPase [unclassified Leisingera]MCF6433165.1 VirB4 family type IV secretion/conjugal transfer ATPase [Leisingera sp. MMG026]QAX32380.1 VirB4 family type IV secretion/conjugal transfer ATPase [Leisingera sp. NJS204]
MGFNRALKREITATDYLPFVRHADEHTIITANRGAFQMLKIEGASFRTADTGGLNSLHDGLNHHIRNIADDNVIIYSHIIRSEDPSYPDGEFSSEFSDWLDNAYREQIQGKRLYRNDIYLTIYMQPRGLAGSRFATGVKRARKSQIEADQDMLELLEDKTAVLVKNLSRYGARRLGLVNSEHGFVCSEPMSVLRQLITGRYELTPLVRGNIGSAIYTDRVIFGREALEIRNPADSTFGAMFGVNEYPSTTRPTMLSDLLTAPFTFILSQSFRCVARSEAIKTIKLKEGRMRNAGDDAVSQADELRTARDDLMSGNFVMGEHNMSLLIFGHDLKALRASVSDASNLLANSGAIVAREDLGIESAFWAQLPGNHSKRLRPALMTSRNFTALSPLHNYPTGHRDGNRWGKAVAKLKTSADSSFYLNFHVGDLGHTAIYGPSGSGKTVVINYALSQLERLKVKRVLFDKDRGGEIFVRAAGGTYLALHTGERTGCAPFKALDLTPANAAFLVALTKAMLSDPQHPFTADDNARIEAAINGLGNVPQEQRSVSVLRELIGFGSGEADDIGNRLNKWADDGRLAWVFDNDRDEIGFEDTLIGFDITSFLDDPTIRNPMMMYLMQRVEQLITGQRIAIVIDEFWKALADDFFVDFVKDKLKVIRKQNGIVIAGTQSTSDVVNSPIARTVIEQCATQIFFANEKANETELTQEFGLTKREYQIVRNELSIGQFLIKQGGNSVVCELDLRGQDDALAVLSGRTEETKLMNNIRTQHPDPAQWLPIFHIKRKDLS